MESAVNQIVKRPISFVAGLLLGIVLGIAFGNLILWSGVGIVLGFAFIRMQDN